MCTFKLILLNLRRWLGLGVFVTLFGLFPILGSAADKAPVLIGLDGEFHLEGSTSAESIEWGLRAAMAEINAAGGVLGGRPLSLLTREHHSMPARGIRNLVEFAATPDLVAVFGGRFSPVVIEELPTIKKSGMLFMAVWSSADDIVDNGMQPNWVFRLSLRDSLAMPKLLSSAKQRGYKKVGLLMVNTGWGRSNLAAAEKYQANNSLPAIVKTAWYNFGDRSLVDQVSSLRAAGAQAIITVMNDDTGAIVVKEMAALPLAERLPIISHWGLTGGDFPKMAGPGLQEVDLSVIQTFSFFQADSAQLKPFMASLAMVSPIRTLEAIPAPVGMAHAYDLMHILAKAINLAGSTDRAAVRSALERLPSHRGLIKHYNPAFTSSRHEALGEQQLLMARYDKDGILRPEKSK